ncbi:MAG: phosphoglycerate transporter [Candidatus Epulonipiscioides saccharophilum]|nr:MAG: phosphoglycerate transporter [Epulopiscium sp. AS2M-Bin001]
METYFDLVKEKYYNKDVCAFKGTKGLIELNSKIDEMDVMPIFLKDKDGMRIFERTCTFLMIVATKLLFNEQIVINHHMSGGYFGEFVDSSFNVSNNIGAIKAKMLELVEQNLPINKKVLPVGKAIDFFESMGMLDKSELIKYRRTSTINTYILEGVRDYFYGYMLPNTGCIKVFDLYAYGHGFMLSFPDKKDPTKLAQKKDEPKLFEVFTEAKQWARILGVDTVAKLNQKVVSDEIADLIRMQEALHEKKIAKIADNIASYGTKKVILIAGPSSSGKTTFSKRLCVQLKVNGMTPVLISMDNYFVNREFTPVDENGDLDFDDIAALDTKLFNIHLKDLVEGKEVEIPSFNFKLGKREYKEDFVKLNDGDVLVIEGIHALNEKISSSIEKDKKYKVYVSALTQLNIDNHNRIPTTDTRLMRRMIRDNTYRGISPEVTLSMWPSVRRGEEKNIFPFQEEADVMFNSVLIYELAVLKQKAEALLFSISRSSPYFDESKRLLKFLEYFLGIDTNEIPCNSLLREFIGGSCLE